MADQFSRLLPEVMVESVAFGNGILQITYSERRETNDYVSVQRSMVIDGSQIADELSELQDLLRELVDKGARILRAPPERVRHGVGEG